jgi:hypothetical protein
MPLGSLRSQRWLISPALALYHRCGENRGDCDVVTEPAKGSRQTPGAMLPKLGIGFAEIVGQTRVFHCFWRHDTGDGSPFRWLNIGS